VEQLGAFQVLRTKIIKILYFNLISRHIYVIDFVAGVIITVIPRYKLLSALLI